MVKQNGLDKIILSMSNRLQKWGSIYKGKKGYMRDSESKSKIKKPPFHTCKAIVLQYNDSLERIGTVSYPAFRWVKM